MIVKGKTKSGFKYEIERDKLSSWNFTKTLAKAKSGSEDEQYSAVVNLVGLLLTPEQEQDLVAHLQKTLPPEKLAGGVPASAVLEELGDIFKTMNEKTKN